MRDSKLYPRPSNMVWKFDQQMISKCDAAAAHGSLKKHYSHAKLCDSFWGL